MYTVRGYIKKCVVKVILNRYRFHKNTVRDKSFPSDTTTSDTQQIIYSHMHPNTSIVLFT